MKKIIVGCLFIILILCVLVYFIVNKNDDKIIYENDNDESPIVNTNALTMMYETEASSGEYVVSNDTSWPQEGYTFNAELSGCENGGTLSWDSENNRLVMKTSSSDKCFVYFDYIPTIETLCSGKTLSECITTYVYTGIDGDNGLYLHDGIGTYTNADQEAGDNSYRYAGANPNNYVKIIFNGYHGTFRIIGVFDNMIKLIQMFSGCSNILWDDEFNTEWNDMVKPDIYNVLLSGNCLYYDYNSSSPLNVAWEDIAVETEWSVGGIYNALGIPKLVYDYEVGSNETRYKEKMLSGLVYISEYGYAADPQFWQTEMKNYNNSSSSNWLSGKTYITLSSRIYSNYTTQGYVYLISGNAYSCSLEEGCLIGLDNYTTVYLKPDILYISGEGTINDPYIVYTNENQFSFNIGETTYYAEKGMTCIDWDGSYYCDNILGDCFGEYVDYDCNYVPNVYYIENGEVQHVLPNDLIDPSISYLVGNYPLPDDWPKSDFCSL